MSFVNGLRSLPETCGAHPLTALAYGEKRRECIELVPKELTVLFYVFIYFLVLPLRRSIGAILRTDAGGDPRFHEGLTGGRNLPAASFCSIARFR